MMGIVGTIYVCMTLGLWIFGLCFFEKPYDFKSGGKIDFDGATKLAILWPVLLVMIIIYVVKSLIERFK